LEKKFSFCDRCRTEYEPKNDRHFRVCPKCTIEEQINKKIPKIYRTKDTERSVKDCMGKSVFCYGSAGTGKTQFIATLAKGYIHSQRDIVWASYPSLIMEIQTMYRNEKKDPFEFVMGIAKDEKVLIIDDIGVEKLTDFVKQITYMLINKRYEEQLITLITSNKNLSEIDTIIHPGIASRIAGMCEVLEFKGKDFRVKN
jgi:DNA replication protein DnaC